MALSLPSLPTDNLYKFVALSGIALIVFAYYLTFSRMWSVQEHIADAEESLQMLSAHTNMLQEKKQKWEQLVFEEGARSREGKSDTKSDEETKAAEESLVHAKDDLAVEMVKLSVAAKRVKNEWIWLAAGGVMCVLAVVTGSLMAHWGFRNWYRRIQLPMDAQIRKQAIDGAADETKSEVRNEDKGG
jgi:Flp pilus assembly protein TadB